MPNIVGITGGIGSGKTRIVELFESLGVPCYIADREAKRLMNEDADVKKAIIGLFGNEAYASGILDRTLLGNIVFTQPQKLNALNAIVHPAVAKDFKNWVDNQHYPYVIKEVASYLKQGYKQVDKTLLITAQRNAHRTCNKRDASSKKSIIDRMQNQWSDDKKIPLADFVIENSDGNKQKEVKQFHQQFLNLKRINIALAQFLTNNPQFCKAIFAFK